MLQICSVSNSLSHSKTLSNRFRTLSIKWEVHIFFLRTVSLVIYSLRQYVFCIYMWMNLHIYCVENTTIWLTLSMSIRIHISTDTCICIGHLNLLGRWRVAVEYTAYISAEGLDYSYECPGYDTIQSDSDAPVKLDFWRIQNTSSWPSLPDPLGPGVLA